MTIYVLILILIPSIWIAFEIYLVFRDKSQDKGKTTIDKGTRYLNFIAMIAGISLAALLNGFTKFFFAGSRTALVFYIGVAVSLAGLALRIWSVSILGKSFRTTIETDQDQKVVSSGPYKLIRHPAYSGLLLICCGYGIALQNWLSLLAAVILPLAALLYRIYIEEPVLAASLGPDYVAYQKRTKKLIPWVW
jgi:protein-S-isoprenylcysteine O-methyltransferase Ste14